MEMSEQTTAEVVKAAISVGAYREGSVFPRGDVLLHKARELVRLAQAYEPGWKGRETFKGKPNPCPAILSAYEKGCTIDLRRDDDSGLAVRVAALETIVRHRLLGDLAVAMRKLLGH